MISSSSAISPSTTTPLFFLPISSLLPTTNFKSPTNFKLPSTTNPSISPLRCINYTLMDAYLSSSSEQQQQQFEGNLCYSRAYWVTQFLIASNVDVADHGSYFLYSSKTADLTLTNNNNIQGHDVKIKLQPAITGLPPTVVEKFPHIRDYKVLIVPNDVDVKSLLKTQLAVGCFNASGECIDATGIQLPGVLDDLYSYEGPLGAVFSTESVSLHLWAPTAQAVSACIYQNPSGGNPLETVPLKEVNGVWSVDGPRSWEGCYYAYAVSVYHPSTLKIETCIANDPYARGLSSDGKRTLFINLDCDKLKPKGWDDLADEKPELPSFTDISIYELHIRDFSANDHTVDPDHQGGYLAFTYQDTAGIRHLKKLSNAGLTHVHLLPTFQFAEVDDQREKWKNLDPDRLATLPSDSDEQQAQVTAIQDEDGYNWGYNPVLWGVPKGSYASNPNGPCRSLEFRKMVQSLNRIGIRVVLDVVYNHLHGSGPHDNNSVLDKVVPGYYLRRNTDGSIENSTCVNNTASEHFMVDRMIVDDLLCWAAKYKVDGFRFDLMGHIMKRTMVKAKNALHSLSKDTHGVDGSKIYIYGEGWNFGEVANNGRGVNAAQFNLYGSGIGSFNDRIRDAVLGGSPFGHPLQQGFATGLSYQPNGYDHGGKPVVDDMLAASQDHIQVGMAANLRDFVLTSYQGEEVKGVDVLTYGGSPVAYASCPIETINYVSAHDNETLFDIISLKTPMEISLEERCRLNHLATSIVALSQGIPFFHCGDDMLRSKSLDRDSYNSGDWFNRLDFTYESNNWGVGLPPKGKNEKTWPLIKPRLGDASFKPHKTHILAAVENFCTLLRICYSSPLFRLQTVNAILKGVSIEDGYQGVPGLAQLDPIYSYIVVAINACPSEVEMTSPALKARSLELHPIQVMWSDELVKNSQYDAKSGTFTVPPRTTSVFVESRTI
ncbi:Pullulanase 1 [Ranunculus cassubicifolius]